MSGTFQSHLTEFLFDLFILKNSCVGIAVGIALPTLWIYKINESQNFRMLQMNYDEHYQSLEDCISLLTEPQMLCAEIFLLTSVFCFSFMRGNCNSLRPNYLGDVEAHMTVVSSLLNFYKQLIICGSVRHFSPFLAWFVFLLMHYGRAHYQCDSIGSLSCYRSCRWQLEFAQNDEIKSKLYWVNHFNLKNKRKNQQPSLLQTILFFFS